MPSYPRQFWLLIFGTLFSFIGTSMIWPLLLIYVNQKVDISLTATTSLFTVSSVAMFISSFLIGPVADQAGRKGVMVIGLVMTGISYLLFIPANSYLAFFALMAMRGFFRPLFRIGSDAMVADLIPTENRPDAYALMRMTSNTAIALGPAIGGFVAERSYTIVFIIGAIALSAYGLMIAFFMRETLPSKNGHMGDSPQPVENQVQGIASYIPILKDRVFMSFIVFTTLALMASTLMFTLLPLYANEMYNIPESRVGLIITANAGMVVLLQYAVTMLSKRFPNMAVMMVGALLYAVGVGSVALGNTFFAFLVSMVVMTSGELMLVPTASTTTADLAPPEHRGKYMSLFGLTWGVASGLSPLIGGFLSDMFTPRAIWIGGFVYGMLGMIGFAVLARKIRKDQQV